MTQRPTVADLPALRGKKQLSMLVVTTLEEAEAQTLDTFRVWLDRELAAANS